MRLIPLWTWKDTPQRSFFRLYEAFCAGHEEFIGYETEYFWKHSRPAGTVELLRDHTPTTTRLTTRPRKRKFVDTIY
ncbi:hypothetical protein C8A01DRAFT_33741 [Parachaetomium inaequale]|uniref:Uncharacterized protein n=1 Tax=Parachaetomium inaequale TaxID=2588326 RepID=A0AAN6PNT2_9PEZI|nr:hypothetical protein C8A01DRAFT_33741 [Parachaetomium inaequale]